MNGKVDMFKATMRLAVDLKWGKVEVAGEHDKKPTWDVNVRRPVRPRAGRRRALSTRLTLDRTDSRRTDGLQP